MSMNLPSVLSVERSADLVEQFIIVRLHITLINIVTDDESFKRHFGEVSRERVLSVNLRQPDGRGRQGSEPVEIR